MQQIPRIGIASIIYNPSNKSILMSNRKKENMIQIAAPGGHLELFEQINECASRELFEETGINIQSNCFQQLGVFNTIRKDLGYHYVTFYMCTVYDGQEIINKEPHKHEDWTWIDLEMFKNYYEKDQLFHNYQRAIEEYGGCEQFFEKIEQLLKQLE